MQEGEEGILELEETIQFSDDEDEDNEEENENKEDTQNNLEEYNPYQ